MSFSKSPLQACQKIRRPSPLLEKRILIMDDQQTLIFFLCEKLQHIGFQVSATSSAEEGIDLLHNYPFCGILLDLEMPEINGGSMLHLLQELSTRIPVIIMSIVPTQRTGDKAIELEAKDYLEKPISFDNLAIKCTRMFA